MFPIIARHAAIDVILFFFPLLINPKAGDLTVLTIAQSGLLLYADIIISAPLFSFSLCVLEPITKHICNISGSYIYYKISAKSIYHG